ncbi:MAG: bifunctional glutamate N-acetyltransferase/amino-acid acetyltransferase ArgJ [Bacteriovoracaceae bacterium]
MIIPGPGTRKTPLPKGFRSFSINAGIRKYRPDLGVLYSKYPAKAAAVYTKNTAQSHHIQYCQEVLPTDNLQAIITNSGQANTATGPKGAEDNLRMVHALAMEMKLTPSQIATASTGVIGMPLAIEKIERAIPDLVNNKGKSAERFATAIMTTDLVPKAFTTTVNLSEGEIRLTGICKGSGMIHPNMATMLGYIATDVSLDLTLMQSWLKEVVEKSFNMISVDGETSPNDTVFMMANGASEVEIVNDQDKNLFMVALLDLATHMAKSIAADGEGASKLIEVKLKGAPKQCLAKELARSLVTSPLVKTAIHGGDPNWGRIYSRLGQFGAPKEILETMNLSIQGISILKEGEMEPLDFYEVRTSLGDDHIEVNVDFKSGDYEATAWGCDLTKKYVDINTEYN